MCGIVGYVGTGEASEYLLDGLRRLEYRGYDSSGIVTLDDGKLAITKTAGRVKDLDQALKSSSSDGAVGIGHTRWATHGPATDGNAHPHFGGDEILALVHNGVIENFRPIKKKLQEMGYEFHSDTDSEVVAQLIAHELSQLDSDSTNDLDPYAPLVDAVQKS